MGYFYEHPDEDIWVEADDSLADDEELVAPGYPAFHGVPYVIDRPQGVTVVPGTRRKRAAKPVHVIPAKGTLIASLVHKQGIIYTFDLYEDQQRTKRAGRITVKKQKVEWAWDCPGAEVPEGTIGNDDPAVAAQSPSGAALEAFRRAHTPSSDE